MRSLASGRRLRGLACRPSRRGHPWLLPAFPHGLHGNVLLFTAAFLPIVFAFLAFGVDATMAIEAKMAQECALQTAQELRMAPAITLKAKNATDPGAVIAETVMSTLRREGYAGSMEVWFYEAGAPEGLSDERRRVYAFEVIVSEEVPTAFTRLFGTTSMEVASSFTAASQPYAEFAVWKPTAVRNGVYRLEAGNAASQRTFTSITLDGMPADLRAAIGAGLNAERERSHD